MEHTVSNNLLQYDDPIELSAEALKAEQHAHHKHGNTQPKAIHPTAAVAVVTNLKSTVDPTQEELDEIITAIFPPEEFDDYDGNSYRQKVSTKQADLEDVKALEERLDARMRGRHARLEGLCIIRRELFAQAMNELIRQEIIECPERGLLIKRIRDELRMTYNVYKSLFESTTAYESRKSVMLESTNAELEKTILENEPKMFALRKHLQNMQDKVDEAEARVVEQTEADHKRRVEEVEYHKSIGTQLRLQLDKILAPKKI